MSVLDDWKSPEEEAIERIVDDRLAKHAEKMELIGIAAVMGILEHLGVAGTREEIAETAIGYWADANAFLEKRDKGWSLDVGVNINGNSVTAPKGSRSERKDVFLARVVKARTKGEAKSRLLDWLKERGIDEGEWLPPSPDRYSDWSTPDAHDYQQWWKERVRAIRAQAGASAHKKRP